MLYEKNKAEADAKAANIASTLDNENRLQKRQLTGLETITAAQRRKDEAAKAAAKNLLLMLVAKTTANKPLSLPQRI